MDLDGEAVVEEWAHVEAEHAQAWTAREQDGEVDAAAREGQAFERVELDGRRRQPLLLSELEADEVMGVHTQIDRAISVAKDLGAIRLRNPTNLTVQKSRCKSNASSPKHGGSQTNPGPRHSGSRRPPPRRAAPAPDTTVGLRSP